MSGALFGLVAISAITRHDILAGLACFVAAAAFALRAKREWKLEHR